jgi:hypothetical protein
MRPPPDQRALRWEPVTDLPETSCYDISLDSPASGSLRLVLQFRLIRGNANRDLVLDFSHVISFRMHWDGDGPHLREECELPFCNNPSTPYLWPLIEVVNSKWLASDDLAVSREIAKMNGDELWRHFHLSSFERTVDVVARGEIAASWMVHKS